MFRKQKRKYAYTCVYKAQDNTFVLKIKTKTPKVDAQRS